MAIYAENPVTIDIALRFRVVASISKRVCDVGIL